MILLEIKNLYVSLPERSNKILGKKTTIPVVKNLNFSIKEGETLGLVGESGSGKSTTGRAILKLIPAKGEIIFEGRNLNLISDLEMQKTRKNIQMIFQDPHSALNPKMSVARILSEPFDIHLKLTKTEKIERVAQLLVDVGLPVDAMYRYPHEFSGGQKQRIGIARALALNPKLIIADEPVSALDVSIQAQILNLISDLKKKYSLGILFIAHDLAVVEHISDRVAVMKSGEIVEIENRQDLYKNPKHPYTRKLLEAIPHL